MFSNRKLLLLITAVVEAATGLCLLFLPAVLFAILFGSEGPAVDAIIVGRIAGAALLAIGIASGMATTDTVAPAQLGLLTGILVYNITASALLAYAGAVLKMIGVLFGLRLPFTLFLPSGVSVVCVRILLKLTADGHQGIDAHRFVVV